MAPTVWYGVRSWRAGRLRIAVAYLLAFCLLLPVTLILTGVLLMLLAARYSAVRTAAARLFRRTP